jgi:RecB family exonuclease
MLHRVLSQVWKAIQSRQELLKISPDDLDILLRKSSTDAIDQIRRGRPQILGKQFFEIETRRLMSLVRDWLEMDRSREDLTVIESEQSHHITIGGLFLKTRLDRVDEMSDGRRIVIDYKSRSPTVESLVGDRPEEPQIPVYLITTEPNAVAVAFAQVRRGDMKFIAIARDNDLLPGVKSLSESRGLCDRYESWEGLINSWSENLTHLAESFYRGESEVNPSGGDQTCRNCDIQPLCRIYERSGESLPGQGEGS